MTIQKVAVMGAGSVGCYYGAMLALAGEKVVLIGRPAFAGKVTADGLLFEKDGEVQILYPDASADPAAVADADLVLFCVKSQDTEVAAAQIAPWLSPDATVVSLQNGIGNADRLSTLLSRDVIQAVVYVATDMAGPGHVRHRGRGELVLAAGTGVEDTAVRLRRAGVPVEVTGGVEVALWSKLVINCAINPVSAITLQPYGQITAVPAARDLMEGIVQECEAVAAASGVVLPAGLWEQVIQITDAMPQQFSSTAQDRMRGRATEIDYLNGEILRRAAPLGIPVPLNSAVTALLGLATNPLLAGAAAAE